MLGQDGGGVRRNSGGKAGGQLYSLLTTKNFIRSRRPNEPVGGLGDKNLRGEYKKKDGDSGPPHDVICSTLR